MVHFLGLRFSAFLAFVLLSTLVDNQIAFATVPAMDAVTVKQQIASRGAGKSVKVTTTDGTVLTGKIVAVNDDRFEMRTKEGATSVSIPFSQVKDVRNAGLSKGGKIGIVLAVVGAAIAITAAVIVHEINKPWGRSIPI